MKGRQLHIFICSLIPKTAQILYRKAKEITENVSFLDAYVLTNHETEVMEVYDQLEDERSKEIYEEMVLSRVYGRMPKIGTYSGNPYYCWNEFSTVDLGRYYVDCGAYVGDTIEAYLWESYGKFHKIVAFEPDKGNQKAMACRMQRLCQEWNLDPEKIKVIPKGVSDSSKVCTFSNFENGLGSKFLEGADEQVEVVALDEALQDPVTFLKADVESYEYRVLQGATNTIRRYKPAIAICIYHNAVDLYTVPRLLASIAPEYRFAIRHHGLGLLDTVLYAWVED